MKWKKLIAWMLARSPLPGLVRRAHRRELCVLMLHGFASGELQDFENAEHKHLEIAKFEGFARWLASRFRAIPLSEAVSALERGKSLPDHALCLTMDDGFRSTHDLALPVLKKFQLPATIFLATEFVDEKKPVWVDRVTFSLIKAGRSAADVRGIKRDLKARSQDDIEAAVCAIERESGHALPARVDEASVPATQRCLDWDQVREMRAGGLVEFGSHTHSHRLLGRCSEAVARDELVKSKRLIEERTGAACDLFCYPNGQPGDYTDTTERLVREAGYRSSLTTVSGWNATGASPFAMRRLGANNQIDLTAFILLMTRTPGCGEVLHEEAHPFDEVDRGGCAAAFARGP